MAIRRMVQAGVAPITWLALSGEWQRDWARNETLGALAEVLVQHGGAYGIAITAANGVGSNATQSFTLTVSFNNGDFDSQQCCRVSSV